MKETKDHEDIAVSNNYATKRLPDKSLRGMRCIYGLIKPSSDVKELILKPVGYSMKIMCSNCEIE